MFPVAWPAISATLIINFILLWNEFLLANIFIREESLRTLQLGLMQYFGRYFLDYARLATASLISALSALMIYLFLARYIVRGMITGALQG